jgi:cell division protein FtsB
MCHTCSELKREIEALRSGNAVLRANNVALVVQNNNLRHLVGKKMQPITQDYLTAWEQSKEAGV